VANIKEKVAYLQGLTRGLNVSEQSSEGKLLINMVDVLQEMAEEISCIHVAQEDLENYVETIDEDLTDLEEEVYEDVHDMEMVEVECPECHEVVTFESDLLNDDDVVEVTCPSCGEVVYENTLEFADDDMDASLEFRRSMHPGV
jgi:endogenous inhibitor of DNA gyrase (YacG/DUF329 family)